MNLEFDEQVPESQVAPILEHIKEAVLGKTISTNKVRILTGDWEDYDVPGVRVKVTGVVADHDTHGFAAAYVDANDRRGPFYGITLEVELIDPNELTKDAREAYNTGDDWVENGDADQALVDVYIRAADVETFLQSI